MDLEVLKNSTVLLLGKPRAFGMDEFLRQMQQHRIDVVSAADVQKCSVPISAVIEGGLLNPLEQDLLEQLYFENKSPIFRSDTLEAALASHLSTDTLLMSLKLSNDTHRLYGFLTNPLIDDGVFLKLLKLYNFKGQGFFDTNENRDVTTALIERFYDNLEQNHNIQYISMGVVELINKSDSTALINTIASFSMVVQALRDESEPLLEAVLFALAQHSLLQEQQQLQFAKSERQELCRVLALREDMYPSVEAVLLTSQHDAVLEALASNTRLSDVGVAQLMGRYEKQILAKIALSDARFEQSITRHPVLLAGNPTLSTEMFASLLALQCRDVDAALAANASLLPAVARQLYQRDDYVVLEALAQNPVVENSLLEHLLKRESLHAALAGNPRLCETMIYQLYRSANRDVLQALAANEATPLALLYELLLDVQLENIVRQNSALNTKYQR